MGGIYTRTCAVHWRFHVVYMASCAVWVGDVFLLQGSAPHPAPAGSRLRCAGLFPLRGAVRGWWGGAVGGGTVITGGWPTQAAVAAAASPAACLLLLLLLLLMLLLLLAAVGGETGGVAE